MLRRYQLHFEFMYAQFTSFSLSTKESIKKVTSLIFFSIVLMFMNYTHSSETTTLPGRSKMGRIIHKYIYNLIVHNMVIRRIKSFKNKRSLSIKLNSLQKAFSFLSSKIFAPCFCIVVRY